MKKINLEDIIETLDFGKNVQYDVLHHGYGVTMYTREALKLAMSETCKQVLKLAAKNAKLSRKYYNEYDHKTMYMRWKDKRYPRVDGDGYQYGVDVVKIDKQSILNTINQVE